MTAAAAGTLVLPSSGQTSSAAPIIVFDTPNQLWWQNYANVGTLFRNRGYGFLFKRSLTIRAVAASGEVIGPYPIRRRTQLPEPLQLRLLRPGGPPILSPALAPQAESTPGGAPFTVWTWELDTLAIPDGSYLLTSDHPRTIAVSLLVKNSPLPSAFRDWIAIAPTNQLGDASPTPSGSGGGWCASPAPFGRADDAASGTIRVLAGSRTGEAGVADGDSLTARFDTPRGVARSPWKTLLIGGDRDNSIREVSPATGEVSTYLQSAVDPTIEHLEGMTIAHMREHFGMASRRARWRPTKPTDSPEPDQV